MKRRFLLVTGLTVLLASCGSNNDKALQTRAQIDSAANAIAAKHQAQNEARNDSTLKAIELERAEQIRRERSGKKEGGSTNPAPEPTEHKPAGTK